jgi:integrase
MPVTPLTSASVHTLQPIAGRAVTDYMDASSQGLRLRILVGKDGSVTRRSWAVSVPNQGKTNLVTIGTTEDLTLEKARQEATRIRSGSIPALGRSVRFSVVAGALRDTARYREWKPITRSSFDYSCKRIIRDLEDAPVHKLTLVECQALIEATKPGMARKLAEGLRIVLGHAVDQGIIASNPALRLRLPKKGKRARILDDNELRLMLRELRARQKRSPVAAGLRLVLLTCCRPGEAARATTSDFAIVGEQLWWTVPPERSKTGMEIRRPLSQEATNLVLPRLGGKPTGTSLFGESPDTDRQALWFRRAIVRIGISTRATPHDLRRTSRSLLSRLGVRAEVSELLLGHILGGVLGIYDRYSYEAEKIEAMRLLAGELDRIECHVDVS